MTLGRFEIGYSYTYQSDLFILLKIFLNKLSSLSKKMEQLSQYAAENENVRFDIVLTNPKPRLSIEEKRISNEILFADLQEHLFLDSRELFQKGCYESSYLFLTILLENLLRKFAVKNRIIDTQERIPIKELANLLFESRKISNDNLAYIRRFMENRNRIVHDIYKPEKDETLEYINFVSHFINKVSPEIRKKTKKRPKTPDLSYLT